MMLKKPLKKKLKIARHDSNPILIIDGNALCHMAKYTTGGLTYMGEPTGIIFGLLKRILGLAKKFKTNKFIFCWDTGITYRHIDFSDYKRKRWDKKMMDAQTKAEHELMMIQIIHTRHYLKSMGFGNAEHCYKYYEGDDLIAIFTNKLYRKNHIIIVSSDNDLYQLLDKANIYHLHKKKIFTSTDLQEQFGISPTSWALAKAIGGCDVDGIPGIRGVADAKKPTSKALSYIRGELKKGKILDRIESKEGEEIRNRNLQLVDLPHRNCDKTLLLRRDTFSKRKFIKVFDNLHFKSFLEDKKFKEWEESFL